MRQWQRIKRLILIMMVSCSLLSMPVVAAADPLIREPSSYRMVVVKPGDSLWKIARTYCRGQNPNEVCQAIREMNRIGKYIYPGDRLIIPAEEIRPAAMQVTPSRGQEERVLICQATAYCYTGNRTATMTWPVEGRTIAVDPKVIPLRSRVYVSCDSWPEINGYYLAEDTGGLIKGNIIDIYMNSREQALKWGRRMVTVRIVNYPGSA